MIPAHGFCYRSQQVGYLGLNSCFLHLAHILVQQIVPDAGELRVELLALIRQDLYDVCANLAHQGSDELIH